MKILIINDRPHQFSLLKGVSDNLFNKGINIDVFIINSGLFYSTKGVKKSPFFILYGFFCKFTYGRILIHKLFSHYLVYKIAKKYDAVDFQGLFVKNYLKIIPKLNMGLDKRIKVTIWGSDFYRQAGGTFEEKEKCFKYVDIIHIGTQQMADDFIGRYPQYKSKVRIAQFGLEKMEIMKQMCDLPQKNTPSFLNNMDDKTVIVCGYNGIPAQQHKIMIDALQRLPDDIKGKLFIVIPMTYGTPQDYKNEVKDLISKTQLEYHIIDYYMSEEELIALRFRTDIAVNIQTTDAFASSIQEHIMAGNLLVVGDWLPYHKIFEDNNIFVRFTTIEDLESNLIWAIDNYKKVSDKLKNNRMSIYNFSSWRGVVDKWVNIYKELLGISDYVTNN